MLTLYQFAGSHFCEKARWALDYKGLAWTAVNLVPGLHRRTARALAPRSQLPILLDQGQAVQGSTAIIDYLDRTSPQPPLTPVAAREAQAAREWERYLDSNVGVPVRLYFYHHALAGRRLATEFLLRGTPWWSRPLYAFAFPLVRRTMRRAMGIDAGAAAAARRRLLAAFDRLEAQLQGQRFLAGAQFSRADLTAGALLEALCTGTDPLPAPLQDFRDACQARPLCTWVRALRRDFRRAGAGAA